MLQVHVHGLFVEVPEQLTSIANGLFVVVRLAFAGVSLTDMATKCRSHIKPLLTELAFIWKRTVDDVRWRVVVSSVALS